MMVFCGGWKMDVVEVGLGNKDLSCRLCRCEGLLCSLEDQDAGCEEGVKEVVRELELGGLETRSETAIPWL
jgi:hypothetical protein